VVGVTTSVKKLVALKNRPAELNFLRHSIRKFYFGVTRILIIKGGIGGKICLQGVNY